MSENLKSIFDAASPVSKALIETQARRANIMYGLLEHIKDGSIEMPNVWVGKTIMISELEGLAQILIKRRIIDVDEWLTAAAERLEHKVDQCSGTLGVIITTDGVLPRPAQGELNVEGQAAGTGSGEASESAGGD